MREDSSKETGNYIAEYYGYRVYPKVASGHSALSAQEQKHCPFLSLATGEQKTCTKREEARGVCTVSTVVDTERHDWLVCPSRALDPNFMEQAARRLFRYPEEATLHFIAAPKLSSPGIREQISQAIKSGDNVLVYFQEKLGGEIGISKTPFSPEFSFDWTLVELTSIEPELSLGRFGILELQTMDFHGSYKHAVELLEEEIKTNASEFHKKLQGAAGKEILSKKIEGPNLSNVFKRTFYQMAYKFQLAGHDQWVGGGFAVPYSVWNSWARHLANPRLHQNLDGTYFLADSNSEGPPPPPKGNSWIFVFTLEKSGDKEEEITKGGIKLWRTIKTDAEILTRLALQESPKRALGGDGSISSVTKNARKRIGRFWPESRRKNKYNNPGLF
ncbi:hypothetical protein ACFWTE_03625 [Nocardiopsis sp. NPDC058631]|uniref:hypothetical protein n=1 Tax=Nocardiopsis sp. NPDC058631 TaxID=3346566 RepID=UPI0036507254